MAGAAARTAAGALAAAAAAEVLTHQRYRDAASAATEAVRRHPLADEAAELLEHLARAAAGDR